MEEIGNRLKNKEEHKASVQGRANQLMQSKIEKEMLKRRKESDKAYEMSKMGPEEKKVRMAQFLEKTPFLVAKKKAQSSAATHRRGLQDNYQTGQPERNSVNILQHETNLDQLEVVDPLHR